MDEKGIAEQEMDVLKAQSLDLQRAIADSETNRMLADKERDAWKARSAEATSEAGKWQDLAKDLERELEQSKANDLAIEAHIAQLEAQVRDSQTGLNQADAECVSLRQQLATTTAAKIEADGEIASLRAAMVDDVLRREVASTRSELEALKSQAAADSRIVQEMATELDQSSAATKEAQQQIVALVAAMDKDRATLEDKSRVALEQSHTISRLQDELLQLHADLDAARAVLADATKAAEAVARQREAAEQELTALRGQVMIDIDVCVMWYVISTHVHVSLGCLSSSQLTSPHFTSPPFIFSTVVSCKANETRLHCQPIVALSSNRCWLAWSSRGETRTRKYRC
jgi:chromosome segregation ATPase